MLINMNEAFRRQKHVVAFNFCNIETLSGILDAAELADKIVIASFGESYLRQMPISVAAAMAKAYANIKRNDFVLHLDHASNADTIREAIECGFTSVMYDGSKLPLNENIQNTQVIMQLAKTRNVSVEGELGYLNKEDGSDELEITYTEVKDARTYVENTQVDALAIAVGNAHGLYKKEPHISLERIHEIAEATKTPLVLHGSSGISKEVIEASFGKGIRKINVNTEIALAASDAAYRYIQHQEGKARFENVMMVSKEAVQKVCMEFLEI